MLLAGEEKGGIDGELVGRGDTRKTVSQQINEGNTKLADFLSHNDDADGGDDHDFNNNEHYYFVKFDDIGGYLVMTFEREREKKRAEIILLS